MEAPEHDDSCRGCLARLRWRLNHAPEICWLVRNRVGNIEYREAAEE